MHRMARLSCSTKATLSKLLMQKVKIARKFKESVHLHRRTGLEILEGQTGICPTRAKGARTSRGVQGHAPQENFEK